MSNENTPRKIYTEESIEQLLVAVGQRIRARAQESEHLLPSRLYIIANDKSAVTSEECEHFESCGMCRAALKKYTRLLVDAAPSLATDQIDEGINSRQPLIQIPTAAPKNALKSDSGEWLASNNAVLADLKQRATPVETLSPPPSSAHARRTVELLPTAEDSNASGARGISRLLISRLLNLLVQMRSGSEKAELELSERIRPLMCAMADVLFQNIHTGCGLKPGTLINEVGIRLQAAGFPRTAVMSREFFRVANKVMLGLLLDHSRSRNARKHVGGQNTLVIGSMLETLHQRRDIEIFEYLHAYESLRKQFPRQAEIVDLRFFSGLTVEQIADVLEVSTATVKRELATAKVHLKLLTGVDAGDAAGVD
jgi:RNA polymerase sigma-70 factor (ECF subfamily)